MLVATLLAAYAAAPTFRALVDAVPVTTLVALHLTRFVGFYFLLIEQRGELPWAFAVPGGLGDIAVAAGASALLAWNLIHPVWRSAWILWNAAGLVDILFVVATAARLALADPESMAALLRFPLGLLPTFLVPMMIFTHLVLARRLIYGR